MCGIVGFTGRHQAAPILLDGLSKLEYRGYDSAGIAVRDGEKDIEIIKAKGRLKVLLEKTNAGESVPGMCGIGHTRWATHGEPSEVNAHPHVSDNGNVAAVHNGIIENYQELKEKLLRRGYSFYSSTDTEVAVKLVDYYYQKYGGSPVEAVRHAMVRIRGSYALVMMFRDYPEEIFVARKDSPMILGVENGESYIASDVPAILKYTRNVYYIGNLELACVKPGEITFYNLDGEYVGLRTPSGIAVHFPHLHFGNDCRRTGSLHAATHSFPVLHHSTRFQRVASLYIDRTGKNRRPVPAVLYRMPVPALADSCHDLASYPQSL